MLNLLLKHAYVYETLPRGVLEKPRLHIAELTAGVDRTFRRNLYKNGKVQTLLETNDFVQLYQYRDTMFEKYFTFTYEMPEIKVEMNSTVIRSIIIAPCARGSPNKLSNDGMNFLKIFRVGGDSLFLCSADQLQLQLRRLSEGE